MKLNFNELNMKLRLFLNTESHSYGLSDMFDTSDMDPKNIIIFLNDNFSKIAFDLLKYNSVLKKYIYELTKIQDKFSDYEFVDKHRSFFRLLVKCLCVKGIIEGKLNNKKDFEVCNLTNYNLKKLLSKYDERNIYFRGQTNYEWGICPSIFRNYIFEKKLFSDGEESDGEQFDINSIYNKYLNCKLIDKYNQTIAENKIARPEDLNYRFIAYMQHALSYSPLIDITNKMGIGLQFALGNKSTINDFYGQDAALFVFTVPGDSYINNRDLDDFFKKDFKVNILNKKIKPGKIMKVTDCNGKPQYIDFKTINNIITALKPNFKIIEVEVNDRMCYQKGKFIIFYDYTLVNGRILYSLTPGLDVQQYKILKKSKEGIYNNINKEFPQYNMEYLLNPYLYFNK